MIKDKLTGFTTWLGEKVFTSKIGPNTEQEAEMIHKGVYDATAIWNPKKFVKRLVDVGNNSFEEFEDKELQYYAGFFVTFYALKWVGVGVAVSLMPKITGASSIL